MDLSKQHCQPCSGDEEPLSKEKLDDYQAQVPEWELVEKDGVPKLQRRLTLASFTAVVELVEQIAELAEQEQHHPNLYIHSYNKLRINIYTHKTEGLHVNDFILAKKIDDLIEDNSA